VTRLVGILSNRPDRLRSCISDPKLTALLPNARSNTAFGLVFFQGDELLHKKRPVEEDTPVLGFVGDEIVTDCAVIAYDQLEKKGFHGPDVGPFRFKRWTLAATGLSAVTDATRELVRAPLPDFLLRTLSGGTLEEIAFARVLAELHESNALEDPNAHADILMAALQAVRDALRPHVDAPFGLLLTNGVRVAAAASKLEIASLERRPGTLESTRPGPELRFSAIVIDPAAPADGDMQLGIDRDLGLRH
jgi:hypothetical protein